MPQGRVAAALRFDPSYVELAGVVRGATAVKAAPGDGAQLLNLPDDTAVALHVSGADQAIDAAWPQLADQLEDLSGITGGDVIGEIEQQLDVTLPDDLKVLLGRSFTLSAPQQDLTSADSVVVGGKIVSSDSARADGPRRPPRPGDGRRAHAHPRRRHPLPRQRPRLRRHAEAGRRPR